MLNQNINADMELDALPTNVPGPKSDSVIV